MPLIVNNVEDLEMISTPGIIHGRHLIGVESR